MRSNMWAAVTNRFRTFYNQLQLTTDQVEDGLTKLLGVRRCLQRAYWGPTTDDPLGFVVGSWGKGTAIRPPNDIDVFIPLPKEVFERFDAYNGNGQSALLQEVKGHLAATYYQSDMRGDGQVVVVDFNAITIEVVPVFYFDNAGRWLMPDTHEGGRWKFTNPAAEFSALDFAETLANWNVRKLIQMMKAWKDHCSVPLKSFQLEVLVAEFLTGYAHRDKDYFYYDWFVRDFLFFLISRRNGYIIAPSSGETVWLGEAWLSKAQTAYANAYAACENEKGDYVYLAGEDWRKIFGSRIPESA